MLLEDVETGSVKSWLLSVLNATDDTGLQELNWKRIVGSYLVRCKYMVVDFLNERTEIHGKEELDELQAAMLQAAQETGVSVYLPTSHHRNGYWSKHYRNQ